MFGWGAAPTPAPAPAPAPEPPRHAALTLLDEEKLTEEQKFAMKAVVDAALQRWKAEYEKTGDADAAHLAALGEKAVDVDGVALEEAEEPAGAAKATTEDAGDVLGEIEQIQPKKRATLASTVYKATAAAKIIADLQRGGAKGGVDPLKAVGKSRASVTVDPRAAERAQVAKHLARAFVGLSPEPAASAADDVVAELLARDREERQKQMYLNWSLVFALTATTTKKESPQIKLEDALEIYEDCFEPGECEPGQEEATLANEKLAFMQAFLWIKGTPPKQLAQELDSSTFPQDQVKELLKRYKDEAIPKFLDDATFKKRKDTIAQEAGDAALDVGPTTFAELLRNVIMTKLSMHGGMYVKFVAAKGSWAILITTKVRELLREADRQQYSTRLNVRAVDPTWMEPVDKRGFLLIESVRNGSIFARTATLEQMRPLQHLVLRYAQLIRYRLRTRPGDAATKCGWMDARMCNREVAFWDARADLTPVQDASYEELRAEIAALEKNGTVAEAEYIAPEPIGRNERVFDELRVRERLLGDIAAKAEALRLAEKLQHRNENQLRTELRAKREELENIDQSIRTKYKASAYRHISLEVTPAEEQLIEETPLADLLGPTQILRKHIELIEKEIQQLVKPRIVAMDRYRNLVTDVELDADKVAALLEHVPTHKRAMMRTFLKYLALRACEENVVLPSTDVLNLAVGHEALFKVVHIGSKEDHITSFERSHKSYGFTPFRPFEVAQYLDENDGEGDGLCQDKAYEFAEFTAPALYANKDAAFGHARLRTPFDEVDRIKLMRAMVDRCMDAGKLQRVANTDSIVPLDSFRKRYQKRPRHEEELLVFLKQEALLDGFLTEHGEVNSKVLPIRGGGELTGAEGAKKKLFVECADPNVFKTMNKLLGAENTVMGERHGTHVNKYGELGLMVHEYPSVLQLRWELARDTMCSMFGRFIGTLLKKMPEDEIREYFGEKVAFYYAFTWVLRSYLVWPSVVGVVVMIIQLAVSDQSAPLPAIFNLLYAMSMTAFGTVVLEVWKRRENELAVKWGQIGIEEKEQPRPAFKGIKIWSPVTYEEDEIFPRVRDYDDKSDKRLWGLYPRLLLSYCFLSIIVAIMLAMTVLIATIRKDWTAMGAYLRGSVAAYDGSILGYSEGLGDVADLLGLDIPAIVTGGMTSGQMAVFGGIGKLLSAKFNDNEQHRTRTEYMDAYTAKIFLFEFINRFNPFFFLAFIKGSLGLGCIEDGVQIDEAVFCQDELQAQLRVVFVVFIGTNVPEIMVPVLKQMLSRRGAAEEATQATVEETTQHAAGADAAAPGAVTFGMRRFVVQTLVRPAYGTLEVDGTFDDYVEIANLFGYITLFSVVFPLAGLCGLLVLMIEMRVDGMKMFNNLVRRPLPAGAQDIGTFFTIFDILSWISVVTSSALVTWTFRVFDRIDPANVSSVRTVGFGVCCFGGFALKAGIKILVPDQKSSVATIEARHEAVIAELSQGDLDIDRGNIDLYAPIAQTEKLKRVPELFGVTREMAELGMQPEPTTSAK